MDISQKAKKIIFLMWLLVVPVGICLVYLLSPTKPSDWDHYIYFLILALLTTIFPFFIGGALMVLVQWVNLAIFLKFGILAELIAMQLCMIPIVYHMKLSKETRYKLYYNSFMFFLISIICGAVVLWTGYEIGTLVINDIILYSTIYTVLGIMLNHIFLYFREVFTGLKPKFFTNDFGGDFICLIITLPFGISIYLLEGYVGPIAFILLGVPFLAITLLIRMYSDSEKVNADLNKASEFGHQLAERMTTTEILDMFLKSLSDIFPFDAGYIVDNIDDEFFILRAREDGDKKEFEFAHEDIKYSLAGKVYEKGEPILYNKQTDWTHMKPPFLADDMKSVMCVPIYRNKKIEGVLVLAAREKFAFETYQLKIVHLLCSYFAVSLEKARYVREAVEKSEVCELTKINNYRYLDKHLKVEMERLTSGFYKTVSLIMMDIDKFKGVNDTYGHHAGNIILQEFAKIIKEEIGPNGTVARYGGEEFVILLPNYSKLQAKNIAEQLRRKIEQTPFIVPFDLGEIAREEIVFITASIGVSTAPEDSDEGMTLLRNADRALYIGAKQAGRNRVAEYVK
ncbi:diguanylate cyclase (GGDEF) domain-containing protein [Psychrobacillus sp. OK028]|uniref:sensor domain-containing diguanylate cyclase n=1 Tax=Psychrobacillus sp. OK028 TaxID=1884359 RepID=UPI0008914AEE|nr:sensor domain-containing diguanylate cyclase [Psychrobacillus sp. OK028]SDM79723.1 diguanylate cyclase (GGDEF) domain-containing protein [Psychrobacillus sp. OK028]